MSRFTKVTSPARRDQITFADQAGVIKQAEGGLNWKPLGPITTMAQVQEGSPVMLFNSGAAVGYVKFGTNTVTAPTGAADGIPVAPGEKFIMNSGVDAYVIGSAGIFAYQPDPAE